MFKKAHEPIKLFLLKRKIGFRNASMSNIYNHERCYYCRNLTLTECDIYKFNVKDTNICNNFIREINYKKDLLINREGNK